MISSALFGTISGSAVANVVATGVFTIPLMKKTGYSPEYAGAHEAIASTGGQLMPPVMGIAAFVMAELLQVPYGRIALAGAIPAIAYYFALFMIVDLRARRTGIGSLGAEDLADTAPVLPRLHLFLAPVVPGRPPDPGLLGDLRGAGGNRVAFVARLPATEHAGPPCACCAP